MNKLFFERSSAEIHKLLIEAFVFLEHIRKFKSGAGSFLPLIAFVHGSRTNAPWAKSLKVCECVNSGLFPSHKISLWICS
jgi:hypothetical protein